MGMVPAGPRAAWAGRGRSPAHWSSMPPVPKVALACPGRVHPCPMREACWSPAMPAMVGRPGEDRPRLRAAPDESTMVGSIASGMRSASSMSVLHPDAVAPEESGDTGVGGVGDVEPPPDRVHATQVSTVPKASSPRSARDRSGSALSSRAATLVAEALGATRIPWPWSSRQVPTVRRSCQPSPGPTGTPGGPVPHDGRRPLVGDAHGLYRSPGGQGWPRPPRTTASAMATASNSTSPGKGVSGRTVHGGCARRMPSGRTTRAAHARGAHVDDEDAHGQGTSPKGLASPSLPGLRMPAGIERLLHGGQHGECGLPGRRAGSGPG